MGKKYERMEGQICLDLNTNGKNYVVQSNELVNGKQNLTLNAAKILRTVIMQIKPEDSEFKSYCITIPELSKLLNVSKNNLYRDIDKITDDITTNPLKIKDQKNDQFVKFPWVNVCAYDKSVGLVVQINPLLKPFLLNLQSKYTQYQLEDILAMKSVYAIRIYELIMKENYSKMIPKNGISVVLTIDEIRQACDCEDKYTQISHFKEKVLDIAVREIERTTTYTVNYECIKKGRTIHAVKFCINMVYHVPDKFNKSIETFRKKMDNSI